MSPEYFALALTLFRKGGGRTKSLPPLYYFFSVTSPNVEISPHIFLTFSFNLFTTLLLNFKTISSISNKLLNFNQDHSSKNQFFWSNPYKIEVMITSVIEMLELPNFGQMTASTIYFETCDKNFCLTSSTEIMTS